MLPDLIKHPVFLRNISCRAGIQFFCQAKNHASRNPVISYFPSRRVAGGSGQMSAWYIFTALGFYPVAPASGGYAIGRPFFPKAVLHLTFPEQNTFTIIAHHLSPKNIYVKSVKLDGRTLTAPFLQYSDLFNHKTLEFEMSATPPKSISP
jgi:putative alpha-1,2-mannosidase